MSGHSTAMHEAIIEAGLSGPKIRIAFSDFVRKSAEFRKLFAKPPTEAGLEKIMKRYHDFAVRYNEGSLGATRYSKPETELPVDFFELAKRVGWIGQEERGAWIFLHHILEEDGVLGIHESKEIAITVKNVVLITVGVVERILSDLDEKKQRSLSELLAELNASLGGKNTILRGKKYSASEKIRKLTDSIRSLDIPDDHSHESLAIAMRIVQALPGNKK